MTTEIDKTSKDAPVWQKTVDSVSSWLSWILVPLMMPTYAMLLFFNLSILRLYSSAPVEWNVVLVVFGITAVLPTLLFYVLKTVGIISDIALNGRKERLIPYVITTIAYLCAGGYLYLISAPWWMVMFFGGGAAAALVNMVVNFWWKISAHAAGMAGVAAALVYMVKDPLASPATFIVLIIWLGLCGLLGCARVWLMRHTLMQVLAGYVVGYVSVWLMTMIEI